MRYPIFDGKTDDLITLGAFRIPFFQKETQYNSSEHANRRRRRRDRFVPLEFEVPLNIWNEYNTIPIDEVIYRVNNWLYSNGAKKLKIPDTNFYFIGEFDGELDISLNMIALETITVTFTSEYPFKFLDNERTQSGTGSIRIDSVTQVPTIPLIELSGVTGKDIQISVVGSKFNRIRLKNDKGNFPDKLTIDIENERIYEPLSGVDFMHSLVATSTLVSEFEEFKIKDRDTVTSSQKDVTIKLTYKELIL